ncbi:phosphoglycolate phosphatase [Pseudomaricurvus sp. HS19]|uniref:phosphoglycolate phosphatase n=1 Tax=Pseudomaricurvus sp. HS19 TaxID=2692626 RepID=UPI00136F8490|nr:phosphoglycolate phosphatase [Pseudomaricurvus sp. HS19]MYM64343.1 phosphoglycolate phosphatase [Pseudomaricurvus sp. HS19]
MEFRSRFPHPPRLVMYDLDGTLVDSVPDLAAAVDATLLELGFASAGEQAARGWVGNGAEMLMRRALAHGQGVAAESVAQRDVGHGLQRFLHHYARSSGEHSRLYPGVAEALQLLQQQGCVQTVVTNKPAQFVPDLLADLGIDGYFERWLGGDSLPVKKPDPAPLNHLLQLCGVEPQDALMVGDSVNDIGAARAAGVPVLAVTYGYNHGRPVEQERPDWLTDNLNEFLSAALQAEPC